MSDKKRKLTIHDLPWGTQFRLGDDDNYIKISRDSYADEYGHVYAWSDAAIITHVYTCNDWSDVSTWFYKDGQWWVSHG